MKDTAMPDTLNGVLMEEYLNDLQDICVNLFAVRFTALDELLTGIITCKQCSMTDQLGYAQLVQLKSKTTEHESKIVFDSSADACRIADGWWRLFREKFLNVTWALRLCGCHEHANLVILKCYDVCHVARTKIFETRDYMSKAIVYGERCFWSGDPGEAEEFGGRVMSVVRKRVDDILLPFQLLALSTVVT